MHTQHRSIAILPGRPSYATALGVACGLMLLALALCHTTGCSAAQRRQWGMAAGEAAPVAAATIPPPFGTIAAAALLALSSAFAGHRVGHRSGRKAAGTPPAAKAPPGR